MFSLAECVITPKLSYNMPMWEVSKEAQEDRTEVDRRYIELAHINMGYDSFYVSKTTCKCHHIYNLCSTKPRQVVNHIRHQQTHHIEIQ